jgi:hypothetical protein
MMKTAPDGLIAGRKINVGGVGHFGDYCIVKYGRKNYWVYPSGHLFSAGKGVRYDDIVTCVVKVYTLQGNQPLRVVIDNG